MTQTIRIARTSDSECIASLSGELGYAVDASDIKRRVSYFQASDDDILLVAEVDGGVVGWGHGFIARRVESATFAEIGGLVVTDSANGQGLGRLLVDGMRDWARQNGQRKLRVRCQSARPDAQEFYRRCDFVDVKQQHVLELELE